MTQPDDLKTDERLVWSTGRGTDVWALFCACAAGDLDAVRKLLDRDPSLVRCQYEYRKPLYFAVRENRLEVAAYLLERDPDPTGLEVYHSLVEIAQERGYEKMEKLLERGLSTQFNASERGERVAEAIRNHDIAKMRALLDESPELLYAGDRRGNQPIHWAAMTRQPEVIDELVQRGADLNAKRTDGARPIQLTNGDYHFRGWRDVPKDHPVTPRMVLDHLRACGAECDLCTAAHIGDLERIRELLDADPSLANRPGDYESYYACSGTPIRNAAAAGHLEIVKMLLEHGADPNLPEEGIAPQGHALYSAAANGHHEVVKLLLAHGAHPNVAVESSADTLSRVIDNGDKVLVELLCSHGAARSVDLLAAHNDLQTAAAVFAANPSLADDPEALANAASAGHEGFVRLMLRYHPDLPKRVRFPFWSMGAKTRELNELLFEHGMNANGDHWLRITPLHVFAQKGEIEKAGWFLDHGANLEARDDDICSRPLGWAARFGQKEMVEFLLARGAKVSDPGDPPWATPIAQAKRKGHGEVVEVLERQPR
ncbi:MAG TPA: ankyrin repeat domain-containing protein [Verrucomicrobiales bacterium]|nr:ankyrin repeat domain-containing protein [Verrucomicrobiales bacterium]